MVVVPGGGNCRLASFSPPSLLSFPTPSPLARLAANVKGKDKEGANLENEVLMRISLSLPLSPIRTLTLSYICAHLIVAWSNVPVVGT